jgi:hypothetical protein
MLLIVKVAGAMDTIQSTTCDRREFAALFYIKQRPLSNRKTPINQVIKWYKIQLFIRQKRDLAVSANEWRTRRNRTVQARIKAEFSSLPSLANLVAIQGNQKPAGRIKTV